MSKELDSEARRGRIPFMGLRPRSNEARRLFARKPFRRRPLGYGGQAGRRVFCLWAALARSSQPTTGMLLPRRLAHSQNPSPQHLLQFSDRLSGQAAVRAKVLAADPTCFWLWPVAHLFRRIFPNPVSFFHIGALISALFFLAMPHHAAVIGFVPTDGIKHKLPVVCAAVV